MNWKYLISLILVALAILVFALALPLFGKPLINAVPGLESIFGGDDEKISVQTKEKAIEEFDKLVERYNNCFDAEKKDCFCGEERFPMFPTDYYLMVDKDKLILFDNYDGVLSEATMKKVVNCFTTYEKRASYYIPRNFTTFTFEKGITIDTDPTEGINVDYFDDRFGPLYKHDDGMVCLITKESLRERTRGLWDSIKKVFRDEASNYFKKRPNCAEPKNLNSK